MSRPSPVHVARQTEPERIAVRRLCAGLRIAIAFNDAQGEPCHPKTRTHLAALERYGAGAEVGVDTIRDAADDLADALWELVLRPVPGVFHVTGAGRATWHELASEVFAVVAKQRGGDATEVAAATEAARARVRPCTSEQFPRPAKRPEWSVLDGSAWAAAGFAPLPEWRDGLRRALGAAE